MDTCLLFRHERIVSPAGAAFVPDTQCRLGPALAGLPRQPAGPLPVSVADCGCTSGDGSRTLWARRPAVPLLRRHRMVGELQVPIVTAGGAALAAIDDLQQIPMKAGLVRPEPLHQIRDIEDGSTLARETVNRKPRAGRKLAA